MNLTTIFITTYFFLLGSLISAQDSLFQAYMLNIDSTFMFKKYSSDVSNVSDLQKMINTSEKEKKYILYENFNDSITIGYLINLMNNDTLNSNNIANLFIFNRVKRNLCLFPSQYYYKVFTVENYFEKINEALFFQSNGTFTLRVYFNKNPGGNHMAVAYLYKNDSIFESNSINLPEFNLNSQLDYINFFQYLEKINWINASTSFVFINPFRSPLLIKIKGYK